MGYHNPGGGGRSTGCSDGCFGGVKGCIRPSLPTPSTPHRSKPLLPPKPPNPHACPPKPFPLNPSCETSSKPSNGPLNPPQNPALQTGQTPPNPSSSPSKPTHPKYNQQTLQIRIAGGATLTDLGLGTQDQVPPLKGFAIQCRVTSEDPEQNFQVGVSFFACGGGVVLLWEGVLPERPRGRLPTRPATTIPAITEKLSKPCLSSQTEKPLNPFPPKRPIDSLSPTAGGWRRTACPAGPASASTAR